LTYDQKVNFKVKFHFRLQISIFQLQISIKFDVLKYKGGAMSTQMGTDENEYPNLEMLVARRKAERVATQLRIDNFKKQAALRASHKAEREAALTDQKDATTPNDLEDQMSSPS
jgi:hypothetical protein